VLIMPYQEVLSLGGEIASVSLVFKDETRIVEALEEVSSMFPDLEVYASIGDKVYLCHRGLTVTVWGFQNQLIAMALVVLSLLNITLGGIYERRRYISIYSALGLSPLHVAFMFFSETTVYAVLGAIVGYLSAILFSKALTPILPGALLLNYSSSFVMYSLGGAAIATIIASIYPMIIAAKMVTPSLERAWKPPTKPTGDTWEMPIPFLLNDEEVEPFIHYLTEFMQAHSSREAPDFYLTSKLELTRGLMEGKPYVKMECQVANAPYESGVKQISSLILMKGERARPSMWEIRLALQRQGGAYNVWTRLARTYVDIIRKQILLWRALKPEEREAYAKKEP